MEHPWFLKQKHGKQNQLKNPTYCQVEEPSRPDDAEKAVQVLENGLKDLGDRRRRARLLACYMPDKIHMQIASMD